MKSEMLIYKNCPAVDYPAEDHKYAYTCDVRIEGAKIVVSYFNRLHVVWQGAETAAGHYVCKMKGENVSGDATLHKFPKSNILEGFWTMKSGVNGFEGMWRITLKNPWREPRKGDHVIVTTEDNELVRCKVTGVANSHIKVKDFEPLPFSDYGLSWEYSKD
ncbi:MAG: hypothetical protein A2089_03755 [Elusimicrobia bacterium GWD2_63_28]|nr:MAG: hypothetical protein A2089_03755 [Elusimicrobia bacterium GWD2_63_28]